MPGRYVKTTANATVDHLSKYLALRIALEETPAPGPEAPGLEDVSEKQYTIYITTPGGAFTVRSYGWGVSGPCVAQQGAELQGCSLGAAPTPSQPVSHPFPHFLSCPDPERLSHPGAGE